MSDITENESSDDEAERPAIPPAISGGAVAQAGQPAGDVGHLPRVQAEIDHWSEMEPGDQRKAYRDIIAGHRAASVETMVHFCRLAHEAGDRAMLNLAFEALTKLATPQLLKGAWGRTPEGRKDQAQQILMETFAAIRSGKAQLAENRFAVFAKRRGISLYRKRQARFEGVNERVEPTDEYDPVDFLPARIPTAEARAHLSKELDKLPSNQRAAFIQYHLLGRTQEEIAAAKKVDVRTVRTWLKKAGEAVGIKGDVK